MSESIEGHKPSTDKINEENEDDLQIEINQGPEANKYKFQHESAEIEGQLNKNERLIDKKLSL